MARGKAGPSAQDTAGEAFAQHQDLLKATLDVQAYYMINDPSTSDTCSLGPQFVVNKIPTLLPRFKSIANALPTSSKLPLSFPLDLSSLSQKSPISAWPSVDDKFTLWRNRILDHPESNRIFRTAGLLDFLDLSTKVPNQHATSLISSIMFWSTEYNHFIFPCGILSITLLDISLLTGLLPLGATVSASMDMPKEDEIIFESQSNYGVFLSTYAMDDGPVTVKERIAFVYYWLCKYVLCLPSKKPVKGYIRLAQVIALGQQTLSLSPFILSAIYRGLSYLVDQLKSGNGLSCFGPIWLVQLWLRAYFPALHTLSPITSAETQGHYYLFASPIVQTLHATFMYFYKLSSFSSYYPFRPEYHPAHIRSFFESQNTLDYETKRQVWGHFLISRDLHFDVILGRAKSKCGVVVYATNFFARQSGLKQGWPVPPCFGINNAATCRVSFTDISQVVGVNNTWE